MKKEGAVDHSRETRWFMKFQFGCKNLNYQARLGKPKTRNPKPVVQAKEAIPVSSTWRVSGKLGTSQSSVVCHLHDLGKNHPKLSNCATYYQNIAKLLIQPSVMIVWFISWHINFYWIIQNQIQSFYQAII